MMLSKPPRPGPFLRISLIALCALALAAVGCSQPSPAVDEADTSAPAPDTGDGEDAGEAVALRVASYNTSLFRNAAGALAAELAEPGSEQAEKVAAILQRVRPDVVLLNEFDYDASGAAVDAFRQNYLAVAQGEAEAIDYPYAYAAPSNTGVHSGVDLDGDGNADDTPGDQSYGNDAFGFGTFEGQYGFVVLSRFPIDEDAIRTFRTLRWQQMPENLLPADFYGAEAAAAMRLSSKNHVDVPVDVDGRRLHVLASHPTPPSFDGDEDRNGRRNHDEIRLWVDYVTGGDDAAYLVDDSGEAGGLAEDASFVVMGDLNSDPLDGDSRREALLSLLDHPRVTDPQPTSEGGTQAARDDGQANTVHEGDPALDTADFSDGRVGNLRVDYVLPSSDLSVLDAGVFWPLPDSPEAELARASDHRLVWVELEVP